MYAYCKNNPVNHIDPDGDFGFAIGLYFIPGVGEAALIATLAVAGGYGAWYLGKKISNSLPYKGPKKGSLVLRENGKIKQRRYYDNKGKPKKDMDYNDHGNPKMHPWGPHRHKFRWDGRKKPRGDAEPMNKGRKRRY